MPNMISGAAAEGAVVVGGGLAGLATATLLARAGTPVTVFESAGTAGGRARSTSVAGAALNFGPHAWLMNGPGTRVLTDLGIALPGRTPKSATLRLLIGGRLVHPLARRRGGPGLRGVTGLVRLTHRSHRDPPGGSIAAWLTAELPDPRTRAFAHAVARLSTYTAAEDAQAAEVLAAGLCAQPVRYLDGGWQHLVDALRAAAKAAGADVRTGQPARQITLDEAGVTGVRTADGVHHPARVVVSAVGGPAHAAELVAGPAHDVLAGWARRATPVAMATLDLVLDRRPTATTPLVLGADEPLYLSVHSDLAHLADRGVVAHAARYLRPGERGDATTRTQLEALADRALPGWRAHTVHARFLPAVTVTHDMVTADTGGLTARPGPAVPLARGLFVAGDWVGGHGYLAQASLASAADAAGQAARLLSDPARAPTPSATMHMR